MSEFYQDDDKQLWDSDTPDGFEPYKDAFKSLNKNLDKLMIEGGRKHGFGSYLNDDNPSMQHKACCDSLFHHIAEVYAGVDKDKDSGLHPLYHVILRSAMLLVGIERGLPGRTRDDN